MRGLRGLRKAERDAWAALQGRGEQLARLGAGEAASPHPAACAAVRADYRRALDTWRRAREELDHGLLREWLRASPDGAASGRTGTVLLPGVAQ